MPFRPDGYVLPKSRGGCDVRTLGLYLDAFEKAYLDESVATKIIAIATETATSVLGLNTYKDASPRLYGLMWGAEDLSSDLGARMAHSNGQWTPVFDLARSMCLFAAAHAGVVAIDTVPTEIHNAEALRTESHTARRDGFAAKAAIHPAQVAVINEAFSASAEELAWATRVVAAFRSGDGVATLDGRMLDRPHLKLATRILTRTAAVDAQRVTSFSDHDATTSRPKLKDQQGVSQ
jgi:citrate lyase subunit beta/citryl-CoA lyase